jgi:hypothetical protein
MRGSELLDALRYLIVCQSKVVSLVVGPHQRKRRCRVKLTFVPLCGIPIKVGITLDKSTG